MKTTYFLFLYATALHFSAEGYTVVDKSQDNMRHRSPARHQGNDRRSEYVRVAFLPQAILLSITPYGTFLNWTMSAFPKLIWPRNNFGFKI